MRRIMIAISIAVLFISAVNVFAFKTPNHKRNQWYSAVQQGGRGYSQSGLKKTVSSPALVSRIIEDSNATFNFSTGRYSPTSTIRYHYTENGHIRSIDLQSLDAPANTFYENFTISFTDDGNGNLTTETFRYLRDNTPSSGFEYRFNPPQSDSLAPYSDAAGTGNFLNCQSISMFLYLSTLDVEVQDSGSALWRIAGRDSVLSRNSDLIVFVDQNWDTVSGSFTTATLDSLFLSGKRVVKVAEYSYDFDTSETVYYGVYDANGKEIEENTNSFVWNNSSMVWLPATTMKYIQTFNTHGDLVLSVSQDSTDHWTPLDSCDKYLYTYSYDAAGLIVSRMDSTWFTYSAPSRDIHYFTYQTFPSAVLPRHFTDNTEGNAAKVCSNGMIKTKTPVSVSLYTISGQRIATLPAAASISLWDCLTNNGIQVSKGVYLVKVQGLNTSFTIWRE